MTSEKKAWKLRKANAIAKPKSLEKFAALLHQLGIISLGQYLDISEDVDAQVQMIASTIYEAQNDKP